MEKLKTIKELITTKKGMCDSQTAISNLYLIHQIGEYQEYCYPEQLRQEAIKWIHTFKTGECHTDFAADNRKGQENIEEWIKHFFNITDKELE